MQAREGADDLNSGGVAVGEMDVIKKKNLETSIDNTSLEFPSRTVDTVAACAISCI